MPVDSIFKKPLINFSGFFCFYTYKTAKHKKNAFSLYIFLKSSKKIFL